MSSGLKPRRSFNPSSAARRTISWFAPRRTNSSCHAAAAASCRREMSPRSRNVPASASADERRRSVRSRSKNAAAATSGPDPRVGQSRLALRMVADARDLSLAHDDHLEEARDEAFRAEPLEPLAAHLDEHAIADGGHLPTTQPV